MIIEISDAFGALDATGWKPYLSAIDNLLTAHASGWHVLTPSRHVADKIKELCGLSERQQALLNASIVSRLATLIGQARSADYTLLVVPPATFTSATRQNQIVVPITSFSKIENCMATRLLTEDSSFDGAYLLHVANAVARQLGYGVRINLELMHGGGSGLAKQYELLLADERPSVCVADSDIRFPDGPYGTTAKGILKRGMSNQSGTVRAVILPVRELENSIPISFLLESYRSSPEVKAKVSKFIKHIDDCKKKGVTENLLDFVDFKEGDSVSKLSKIPEPHRARLIEVCKAIAVTTLTAATLDDPASEAKVHQGIAANMLGTVKDFLVEHPRHDRTYIEKLRRTPFWEALEDIFRLILSFGAASVPSVAR